MPEVPRISCVIPAYNAARYVEEAVESAKAQTLPVLEIVVVDDASTDDTVSKVKQLEGVRLIQLGSNAGAASARNAGARQARGELLAFLDADDLWVPNKLQAQLDAWSAHPEWGASVTMAENFLEDSVRHGGREVENQRIAQPLPAYIGSTFVADREAFFENGGLDASLRHSDIQDWVLRAKGLGIETGLVEQVLMRRRIHLTNTSRLDGEMSREEFLWMIKRKLDRERGIR